MLGDEALKKKIIEWLELRKANRDLTKSGDMTYEKGVHGQAFGEKGKSFAGASVRSHDRTAGKWAKKQHRDVLNELKQMPKPSLPKSEVIDKLGQILKKEPTTHHIEDIVSGVRIPHEIQNHYVKTGEPIPREHKLRDLAADTVHQIHRKNKAEGMRMSNKLLGIGEGGVATHPNALPPEKRKEWGPPKMKAKQHYSAIRDEVQKQEPVNAAVAPPLAHDQKLDEDKNIKYEDKNVKIVDKDKIYKR